MSNSAGCGGFLAVIGMVAVLGVGMETYDYVTTYNPLNPPQAREHDPFSWVAAPLAEAYEEATGTP
jgi:hypothetical protein